MCSKNMYYTMKPKLTSFYSSLTLSPDEVTPFLNISMLAISDRKKNNLQNRAKLGCS